MQTVITAALYEYRRSEKTEFTKLKQNTQTMGHEIGWLLDAEVTFRDSRRLKFAWRSLLMALIERSAAVALSFYIGEIIIYWWSSMKGWAMDRLFGKKWFRSLQRVLWFLTFIRTVRKPCSSHFYSFLLCCHYCRNIMDSIDGIGKSFWLKLHA